MSQEARLEACFWKCSLGMGSNLLHTMGLHGNQYSVLKSCQKLLKATLQKREIFLCSRNTVCIITSFTFNQKEKCDNKQTTCSLGLTQRMNSLSLEESSSIRTIADALKLWGKGRQTHWLPRKNLNLATQGLSQQGTGVEVLGFTNKESSRGTQQRSKLSSWAFSENEGLLVPAKADFRNRKFHPAFHLQHQTQM